MPNNKIPKGDLANIQEQRDGFADLEDKIQNLLIDQAREADQRLSVWRVGIGNISFALAIAIVPLLFFTDKEPTYPGTFYLGTLILFVNGVVIYLIEKRDIETGINALGHVGKPELFQLRRFINMLNKVLFYKTVDSYREYFSESNRYVAEAPTEISKSKPIAIWNDIFFLSPILASLLLAREVLPISSTVFWAYVAGFMMLSCLYVFFEYRRASRAMQKSRSWDEKLRDERSDYEKWWQGRINEL